MADKCSGWLLQTLHRNMLLLDMLPLLDDSKQTPGAVQSSGTPASMTPSGNDLAFSTDDELFLQFMLQFLVLRRKFPFCELRMSKLQIFLRILSMNQLVVVVFLWLPVRLRLLEMKWLTWVMISHHCLPFPIENRSV